MPDDNWRWWVGYSEERYHTECDTRDEAVRIAKEEQDGGYICEAIKPANLELLKFFDADRFLEDAEDQAYDDYGDPDGGEALFEVSLDQTKELQSAVRAAIKKWQDENGLVFTSWQFEKMRNEEFIPAPEEETEDA